MSWFNMESMKDGLTNFNMESMKDGLTKGVAQVQTAVDKMDLKIPPMNNVYLEKLTLTTPELRAERQRIDEEELRKETVRNMLANMLPWETRDTERDILVEECKEAILKLSTDKETFFGPYQMPKAVGLGKMKRLEGVSEKEEDNENEKEEHEEEAEEESTADAHKPSKESLEKLAKLEPLPPLLEVFDLDAHVGLIQNLVKVDPRLSSMQSKLSGGGEREKVFWRNYFFHCAFTRYEAGLSIDEIWCEDQAKVDQVDGADAEAADAKEETITFESTKEPSESGEKAFSADPVTDADAPFSKAADTRVASFSESNNEFEMVEDDDGDADDAGEDIADYELDELEAEIARELEG